MGLRLALAIPRAINGMTLGFLGSEGFDDFNLNFVPILRATVNGVALYKDTNYGYPPFFIYSMLPFYVLGGASFASIPILLADAATSALLYPLVRRFANERLAMAAALSYALSPFALYFEGYVWYSSQPMTFFVLLSVFFLVSERPAYSLWVLAVAFLFKQQAIFLLPIPLAWLLFRSRENLVKGVVGFMGLLLGVSSPFLIETPTYYLYKLSAGSLAKWLGISLSVAAQPETSTTTCVSIYTNAQGTLWDCTYGSGSLVEFVPSPPPMIVPFEQLSYDANIMAHFLTIPLFLLLIPAMVAIRKRRVSTVVYSAYAGVGFLILFSLTFYPILKYYCLPIYVLLFATVSSRGTLAVATAAPIIGLLIPSGTLLVPVLEILVLTALIDRQPAQQTSPAGSAAPSCYCS